MEKLRRLQAGEDVEDLLAEIGRATKYSFIHFFFKNFLPSFILQAIILPNSRSFVGLRSNIHFNPRRCMLNKNPGNV
jgi:hypothetical protein